MYNPLVSVIIPIWDKPDTIIQTVQSVLTQTYRNFELLVVGDGCSEAMLDEHRKRLDSLKDDRIKLHNADFHEEHSAPVGGIVPRNLGLKLATGDLIAPLDDDDIWISHHLTSAVSVFEDSSIDFMYGHYIHMSSGIGQARIAGESHKKLRNMTIGHLTVVYRAAFKDMEYRASEVLSSDRDLWERMHARGLGFHFDAQVHGIYFR